MQVAQDEEYYILEPNIVEDYFFKVSNYKEAIEKADIIVFLVAHKEFKNTEIAEGKVI